MTESKRTGLAAVRQQISNLVASRPGIASPSSSCRSRLSALPPPGDRGLLTPGQGLDSIWWGAPRPWGSHPAGTPARRPHPPHRPAAGDGRAAIPSGNADPDRGQARRQSRHPSLYPGGGRRPRHLAAPAGDADPSAELDEALLQQLATLGGGHGFAPATGAIRCHQLAIDTLEPLPAPRPLPAPPGALPPWPLG